MMIGRRLNDQVSIQSDCRNYTSSQIAIICSNTLLLQYNE